KCDGVKPICGPCRKHPKDDDCEYSDGPARSRTKALEDTVSRLEARLHELEHPEETTPSVTLYDPYTAFPPPPPPGRLTIPHLALPHPAHRSLPATPYGSALPRLLTPAGSNSSPESYLAPLSPPSTASTPPFRTLISDRLTCRIHTFLSHATHFGFFLDLASVSFPHGHSPTGPGTPPILPLTLARTSPALLYALCTFGAHLSPSRDRLTEDRFLFRALQECAAATTDANPQSLLHTIQAEVLLAYYFWRTGAFLRARVHAASAGALVFGAGMHKHWRGTEGAVLSISLTADTEYEHPHSPYHHAMTELRLPPPTDSIDAGERIRAVWAVLGLQKTLCVALDPSAEGCGEPDVQLPWPRETEEYRARHMEGTTGENTVQRYLTGQEQPQINESMSTMLVKAQLLFHRATVLAIQGGSQQMPSQAIVAAFQNLSGLVEALQAQLPSRYSARPTRPRRTITMSPCRSHALLDGATLRLHELFVYMYGYGADVNANARCVRTAVAMLKHANSDSGVVSPIIGTLWSSAIVVVVDDLKRLRQQHAQSHAQAQAQSGWPNAGYDYEYENELNACIEEGLSALQNAARDSAAMHRELVRAREAIA
ncbi:hypothetical protein C8F01DRAFT_955703, partial [Mycena amicta]